MDLLKCPLPGVSRDGAARPLLGDDGVPPQSPGDGGGDGDGGVALL